MLLCIVVNTGTELGQIHRQGIVFLLPLFLALQEITGLLVKK